MTYKYHSNYKPSSNDNQIGLDYDYKLLFPEEVIPLQGKRCSEVQWYSLCFRVWQEPDA